MSEYILKMFFLLVKCFLFVNIIYVLADETGKPPPCSSEIFCHGRLINAVQMAHVFPDSKTFVDMKLKKSESDTLQKFDQFMEKFKNKPTKSEIKTFLTQNFDDVGSEFENWTPNDWKNTPKFVDVVQDKTARHWMLHLHKIWKDLGRKIKNKVKTDNDLYSIIWVPNPAIVPGGRFREFYYWDSYWIILGLMISEMTQTAKGMLENFLFMIEKYGNIPNGGRKYYLGRSQPPLFIPMVKVYYDYTQDKSFIEEKIDSIEKEYQYWITKHTKEINIKGSTFKVAFYGDETSGPRPESYREDKETANYFQDPVVKEALYSELKAAAESGWDFSTRWFIRGGTNKGVLTNLNTRSIIPTDLNSVLCWNAQILADFFELLNNKKKSDEYYAEFKKWRDTVETVHWNEDVGAWLDYDTINEKSRNYFYPSNLFPLWTGCYPKYDNTVIDKVLKYIEDEQIVDKAGIPTSFENSGEQWDYRNTWPPLQHMVIVGLNNTGNKKAQKLARKIAIKWIKANYMTYIITGHMYEKYDSSQLGVVGRGGEYDVQLGFGWTNGVIMDLIYKYSGCNRIFFEFSYVTMFIFSFLTVLFFN